MVDLHKILYVVQRLGKLVSFSYVDTGRYEYISVCLEHPEMKRVYMCERMKIEDNRTLISIDLIADSIIPPGFIAEELAKELGLEIPSYVYLPKRWAEGVAKAMKARKHG